MKPLFIFGAGGQARDIAEIAAALDYRPIFAVSDQHQLGAYGGTDEIVLQDEAVSHRSETFALGIGDNQVRSQLAARWAKELRFPTLVHPDTTLARVTADQLGDTNGTIIFPGVRIMGRCHIGNFCTLNLNATVSHDCRIADFANLSPGAHIAGNVHVGQGAWLGMGVTVNQGTEDSPRLVGDWSTVGSGAVVLRDVPKGQTLAGVPAKEIRT